MNGYQPKKGEKPNWTPKDRCAGHNASPAEEKPAEVISIFYECDRRRCKDKCSFPICTHTTDIRHAQNFKLMMTGTQVQMWEEPRDRNANWIFEKEVKLSMREEEDEVHRV